MPELVERGHIYIAQPPLYKIKKGKQERYLLDERELDGQLLRSALESAEFYPTPSEPPISGEELKGIAQELLAVRSVIQRLAHRYDEYVLESLLDVATLEVTDFEDRVVLETWIEDLRRCVDARAPVGMVFHVEHIGSGTDGHVGIGVTRRHHGLSEYRFLPRDFFRGADYRRISALHLKLRGLLSDGAYVRRSERQQTVSSFAEALDWLLNEGGKGFQIQRYKGLGEMNPDQLWETTMNIESRRLLQVTIEDIVSADEIFTTLMGDQVQPRRDFIERYALEAENLDI